jgi:hypothetical protein
VFDPMAVSLVIAYNIVVRKENGNSITEIVKEKVLLETPKDIYTGIEDLEDVEEKEEIPVVKNIPLGRGARRGR